MAAGILLSFVIVAFGGDGNSDTVVGICLFVSLGIPIILMFAFRKAIRADEAGLPIVPRNYSGISDRKKDPPSAVEIAAAVVIAEKVRDDWKKV